MCISCRIPIVGRDDDGEVFSSAFPGQFCITDKPHAIGIQQGERCRRYHPGIGLCAEDGSLVIAIAVSAAAGSYARVVVGLKDGKQEIVVATAAPAPVDVEIVVAAIAVDDEGMTAAARLAGIKDRTTGFQFVVDHLVPFCQTVVDTVFIARRRIIVQI